MVIIIYIGQSGPPPPPPRDSTFKSNRERITESAQKIRSAASTFLGFEFLKYCEILKMNELLMISFIS